MAISRTKKTDQLQALEEKFKNAKGVAFAKFNELTVGEAQTVRRELRAKGMSYTVIKKTLIALAAKNTGLAEIDVNNLEGSVAVIVSPEDAIAPLSSLRKFKKEIITAEKESKFDFAGAVYEGKFIDSNEANELSAMPSKEESLGKIVGMLKSGPQKLHGIFNSGFQKLYNVLENAEKFAS